jgi:hypothetical protein
MSWSPRASVSLRGTHLISDFSLHQFVFNLPRFFFKLSSIPSAIIDPSDSLSLSNLITQGLLFRLHLCSAIDPTPTSSHYLASPILSSTNLYSSTHLTLLPPLAPHCNTFFHKKRAKNHFLINRGHCVEEQRDREK